MRRVDRSAVPPPEVLTEPGSKGEKELVAARAAFAGGASSFDFAAYGDTGVKLALEKLFHGKCAYCESYYFGQAPVDVEHYRPKGKVAEAPGHPGYWWLAMAWENLLPSCIDCNRRRWQVLPALPESLEELYLAPDIDDGIAKLGKQDLFPIAGVRVAEEGADIVAEQALLLEPTIDDPAQHLRYYFDDVEPLALMLPVLAAGVPSPRGLASIHVYGLNRLGLVQERTRVLQRVNFLAGLSEELEDIAAQLRAGPAADEAMATRLDALAEQVMDEITRMAADDQPFCTLVRAWLDQADED